MTSLLICARGYDSLSRARDFFECNPDHTYTRHYIHDNIHEEYRDPSLYIRHIETTYKSGNYDHIIFWGEPSHTPTLASETYSCIFEDVDHILYPTASSSSAMIAWWKKKKTQKFFEGARYIISLSEHSSQFLRESITGKADQHFCLKALPIASHMQAAGHSINQDNVVFDHSDYIATLIGNEHSHHNLELFFKILHTNKYLIISGSDLRNEGYADAQREYFGYLEANNPGNQKDNTPPLPIPEIASIEQQSRQKNILCLVDLHMTSGISETLRWALSKQIPVITLNHHSLSGSLKSLGYPLVLSLARLGEIPDLISKLLAANGERSETWKTSQKILNEVMSHLREDQKRSSRHLYFLIEKHIKTKNVQK